LTFDLGTQYGTYVINKQPPNKQIWLSSPFSGPKRYDYIDGKWIYGRENQTLGELLRQEMATVAKENALVLTDLEVL
jgi:frataxin